MKWPIPTDYQDAVQNPKACFTDPELRAGAMATSALGLPRVASGNFASVYEARSGGNRWAVRCFLRQNGNQQRHYEQVSRHLQGTWLPFMVGFEYQPAGIRIHGQPYPIVKMEWVEGVTLHTFLGKHVHDAKQLIALAAQWRGLVNSLQGSRLAHGDLQHGNALVTPQGQIKLVDYDAMYVPALHGAACAELGHANYQHPQRAASDYDHRLDDFAGLVIYLSLRALASEPALWQEFHTGDNLLFTAKDFKAPARAAVFARLKRSADAGVRTLAAALEQSCAGTRAQTPQFETIIAALPAASVVMAAPQPVAPTSGGAQPQWWTQPTPTSTPQSAAVIAPPVVPRSSSVAPSPGSATAQGSTAPLPPGTRLAPDGKMLPLSGYVWEYPDDPANLNTRLMDGLRRGADGKLLPAGGYRWEDAADPNNLQVCLKEGLIREPDGSLRPAGGYTWVDAAAPDNFDTRLMDGLIYASTGDLRPANGFTWVDAADPKNYSVRLQHGLIRAANGNLLPASGYAWVDAKDPQNMEVRLMDGLIRAADGQLQPANGYKWEDADDPANLRVIPK